MSEDGYVPAHIPTALVRNFDMFNSPEVTSEPHHNFRHFHHDSPEIFWTPCNGGHWVVTRAEAAEQMMRDPERFSSEPRFNKILHRWPRLAPLQYDPPQHTDFRRIVNPWFTPGAVIKREGEIRALAIELIEKARSRASCEFVSEIAEQFSVTIFLDMMKAPLRDRQKVLDFALRWTRTADKEEREEGLRDLANYLTELIEARRGDLSDDMLSHILKSTVQQRDLTPDELIGLTTMMFLGGLDTVSGMLSFVILYLARHPEQYCRLVEDRSIIPSAAEELMRSHGVAQTERGAAGDFVFRGVQFAEGDRIMFMAQMFGIDDRLFADPERVDFDRKVPTQPIFGHGAHRCIGAQLAKTELRIFLEEWVARIDQFSLAGERAIRTRAGIVWSPVELPLKW